MNHFYLDFNIRHITKYFAYRHKFKSDELFAHIPKDFAFIQMVKELFNIERRFYKYIDGQILNNLPSSKDLVKFAVPSNHFLHLVKVSTISCIFIFLDIIKKLDELYNIQPSSLDCNNELKDDEHSSKY